MSIAMSKAVKIRLKTKKIVPGFSPKKQYI